VEYVQNASGNDCVRIRLEQPAATGEVTTHSATAAFQKVLAYGGASLFRDQVDARYMDEARNGTTTYTGSATKTGDGKTITHRPGIIDFVRDQGEYVLATAARDANWDTDQDGMPDEFEKANGLNPDDASDSALYTLDTEKQWYSNLEVYLNSIVEHIMKAGNVDADVKVDEYYPACVNTAIAQPVGDSGVKRIEYFNIDGMRLTSLQKGLNIRRTTYTNGNVTTEKIMK
jgi:hypothetical protein